ncbi:MAG: TOMM precursor leader peptide-binding protein, partial [Pseudomonadota bacterium]
MSIYFHVAPRVAIERIACVGVFFIRETRQWMSTSRIIVELCPLIDGTRDLDSLIAAAAPGLTPAEVIYATQQLERAGVIEARPDRASPEQIPRSVTLAERAGEHWTIAATDAAAAAIMVDALASVRFEQVGERRHLVVVRDYLEPAAGQLMTELSNRGEAWLPIKLRGERAYFGPSFGHGRKACWLCVRARLEANRPVEAFLKREIGRPFGFAHETDAQIGPQGKALAGIVAEHLADERLDDGILEWDGPAGQLRRHAIVACSDCPHCGRLSRCVGALEAPPNLARDIPISRRSGGYRVREAAETVASLAPIISDLTGFIASVGPIVIAPPETGSATEQHHARHVHAAAYLRTPRTTRPMVDDFHGVSLGKGRDAEQAQASAVCE